VSVQDAVKVLAKSLVRNRQYVTKMHHTKANLQSVSLKITVRPTPCITNRFSNTDGYHHSSCAAFILSLDPVNMQTLKSTEAMAKAMAGATKVCYHSASRVMLPHVSRSVNEQLFLVLSGICSSDTLLLCIVGNGYHEQEDEHPSTRQDHEGV
jgi:hypothetical protein